MRTTRLTPTRPWCDDTIAIIAHSVYHLLDCIACTGSEDDVLGLDLAYRLEVLVEEGREASTERRFTSQLGRQSEGLLARLGELSLRVNI